MKRYDILWAELDPARGSEIAKTRPVVTWVVTVPAAVTCWTLLTPSTVLTAEMGAVSTSLTVATVTMASALAPENSFCPCPEMVMVTVHLGPNTKTVLGRGFMYRWMTGLTSSQGNPPNPQPSAGIATISEGRRSA